MIPTVWLPVIAGLVGYCLSIGMAPHYAAAVFVAVRRCTAGAVAVAVRPAPRHGCRPRRSSPTCLAPSAGVTPPAAPRRQGIFVWSFLEYFLHRFIFHLDEVAAPPHAAAAAPRRRAARPETRESKTGILNLYS